MKTHCKKNVLTLQWTMWYFFSFMETEPTSVKILVLFFSYGDRLLNPFNYCSSLVPFNTTYSIDILSLCSSAYKDERDRRKYGILLYFPFKIFTRYWYQSFWYRYWSFVWTYIRSGELYIYRTLPYWYWSFVGTGIHSGKRYRYRSLRCRYQGLLYRYRSFIGSFWPLQPILDLHCFGVTEGVINKTC